MVVGRAVGSFEGDRVGSRLVGGDEGSVGGAVTTFTSFTGARVGCFVVESTGDAVGTIVMGLFVGFGVGSAVVGCGVAAVDELH